jgi:hypothetical protein
MSFDLIPEAAGVRYFPLRSISSIR